MIYRWWDVFKGGNRLTEVRVLGRKNYSGYYRDASKIITDLSAISEWNESQIYFTLNDINEACYSRKQRERLMMVRETTTDSDITARRMVLIDLDPKRPAGVNSSDQELERAHRKAADVYRFLLAQGFNEPIVCMSGNGYHLHLHCSMAVNDETTRTVKRFLLALSMLFSDDWVDVDTKVFNPARICKLYGTTARKGADTPDRPWRESRIVKVPSATLPNDIAYFQKVAAMYPEDEVRPSQGNGYSTEAFDLVSFLSRHRIAYRTQSVADGTRYILDRCPFNEAHRGRDAAIFQRSNGAIGFYCFHNSCQGKTWRDVRLLFEPDAYSQYRPNTPALQNPSTPCSQPPAAPHQTQPAPQPIIQTEDKGKVWLRMSDIRRQPFDKGDFIPSGIEGIDSRGIGFKRGMVSVWTGKRGCGKSSLLNMLMLNAAQKGFKSALWTGELTADTVKQWLFLQAAGKNGNERVHGTDYYRTRDKLIEPIEEWLDGKLWLFNNNYGENYGQIAQEVTRLHETEGLDMILLDNLMVLDIRSLDENKYDRQAVLMQQLTDLAKRLNVHVHLVAHPHKSIGYIRVDNISGSGDIANKADNVFILSRVNNDFKATAGEYLDKAEFTDIVQSECTNVIEIAKFRARGTLMGSLVKLWFEEESNRLKNDPAESIAYNWDEDSMMERYLGMPFDEQDEDTAPF